MKRIFTLLFLLVSYVTSAQELAPNIKSLAKNHLLTVNSQWTYFSKDIPAEEVVFDNDIDRIAYHLQTVCRLLNAQNTEHLSAPQLENRNNTISILEGYAARKVFPTNHYHTKRQPYFIDNYGVHCAVGYLVKETGFPEISKEIARTQNYAYVKEIQSEALLQWAKDYGFSVQELALIQPTYPSENYSARLGNAPNGEVKDLKTSNNKMAVVGSFSEVENGACANIAYYENGVYTCFGNGIEGDAKGIIHYDGNSDLLIVYGEFISNGITYPVAKFENDTWSFLAIPNRSNRIAMAGSRTDGADGFRVSIEVKEQEHSQEVYSYSHEDGWEIEAKVFGEINTLDYGAFGGDFDFIYVHELGHAVYSKGLLIPDEESSNYHTFENGLPSSIHCLELVNQEMYIGGMHYRNAVDNNPILCKFSNGNLSTLINLTSLSDTFGLITYEFINDIKVVDDQLYFGGYLHSKDEFIGYQRHFFSYDLNTNEFTCQNGFNYLVCCIEVYNGEMVIGGKFYHYLVKWDNYQYVGVEHEDNMYLFTFPNPISQGSKLTLEIPTQENIERISIVDMKGSRTSLPTTLELTLPVLSEGTYLLEVKLKSGNTLREKLIIQ
ncbi:Por secretion system C-terminal sorting domain-containing protein [Lishizhenia tianjinensis]|uniref:Por secretion system C-terminal sorting domain-containing protein n=1 Tax=Lishizhenia tianjinensis TaxID=477690 RepID=A0A1I7AKG1_9FLAO|nr:T9SS type A sorting domain-containing protein [Lishizhenia tianjinensis]SFT75422.1 Por secretion system C-terminal sorting domain-containing protein [Lishizhenia tianjinensis]